MKIDFNFEKGVSKWKQIARHKWYYIMIAPIVVWYIIFCYVPMSGIAIAFFDYNPYMGLPGSEFVGFKWFEYLFQNPWVWKAVRNSIILNMLWLVFNYPAPIVLALLFNECRNVAFKRTIQTISYLPHFVSWAIMGGLVYNFLSPSAGFINQIIVALGGEPIYFMAEYQYTRFILTASSIWKGVGWGTILYLAALTGINPELYEAAKLDGASKLKQIWYITLPSISYLITMQLIMFVTGIFDYGMDSVMNLVNEATYETGMVLSYYIYKMGIKSGQFSFATATGLVQSIIGIILMLGANWFARKVAPDGALF